MSNLAMIQFISRNLFAEVSNQVLRVDGEDVNEALNPQREEIVCVLQVVKPIGD